MTATMQMTFYPQARGACVLRWDGDLLEVVEADPDPDWLNGDRQ